jgi:hypothetical protein
MQPKKASLSGAISRTAYATRGRSPRVPGLAFRHHASPPRQGRAPTVVREDAPHARVAELWRRGGRDNPMSISGLVVPAAGDGAGVLAGVKAELGRCSSNPSTLAFVLPAQWLAPRAACRAGPRARLLADPRDSLRVCCLPMATYTASGPGTPHAGICGQRAPAPCRSGCGPLRSPNTQTSPRGSFTTPRCLPASGAASLPAARSSASPSTSRATWSASRTAAASSPNCGSCPVSSSANPTGTRPHGGPARARTVRPMPRLRARPSRPSR